MNFPLERLETPTMQDSEEAAIREWLEWIGEDDQEAIAEVLTKCRQDHSALDYFLTRTAETSRGER